MRQYASLSDLAEYLHVDVTSLSDDTERMLQQASDLIHAETFGRSDLETYKGTVARATCAQVEYWLEAGEATDIEGDNIRRYRIGNVEVDRLLPTDAPDIPGRGGLAVRARRALLSEGLIYKVVQ